MCSSHLCSKGTFVPHLISFTAQLTTSGWVCTVDHNTDPFSVSVLQQLEDSSMRSHFTIHTKLNLMSSHGCSRANIPNLNELVTSTGAIVAEKGYDVIVHIDNICANPFVLDNTGPHAFPFSTAYHAMLTCAFPVPSLSCPLTLTLMPLSTSPLNLNGKHLF